MWVVDTCVLIDLLRQDDTFATLVADALDLKRSEGLTIAPPLTYIELAPALGGDVRAQDYFLSEIGIGFDFEGRKDVVLSAHQAWYNHIQRKRKGEVLKRPIADVGIGAYAVSKGGLITRNEDDFRTLFPCLTIFNPETPRG